MTDCLGNFYLGSPVLVEFRGWAFGSELRWLPEAECYLSVGEFEVGAMEFLLAPRPVTYAYDRPRLHEFAPHKACNRLKAMDSP